MAVILLRFHAGIHNLCAKFSFLFGVERCWLLGLNVFVGYWTQCVASWLLFCVGKIWRFHLDSQVYRCYRELLQRIADKFAIQRRLNLESWKVKHIFECGGYLEAWCMTKPMSLDREGGRRGSKAGSWWFLRHKFEVDGFDACNAVLQAQVSGYLPPSSLGRNLSRHSSRCILQEVWSAWTEKFWGLVWGTSCTAAGLFCNTITHENRQEIR